MQYMPLGKFRGKSLASLAFFKPDYVCWMLSQEATSGPFCQAQNGLRALIHAFDAKPFVVRCAGTNCSTIATRGFLYTGTPRPGWWCDVCSPMQIGAELGELSMIQTYWDAINYVGMWCEGRKRSMELLIRALARAKGLPASEQAVEHFFASTATV